SGEVVLVHGLEQVEAQHVALDQPLLDADVHRTALDAGWPLLAEVAEVALGEDVQPLVVGDARPLAEALGARRLALVRGWEDARLLALAAGDAGVAVDKAGAGARVHPQRVYRADRQARGVRTLEAHVLEEPPPLAEAGDD